MLHTVIIFARCSFLGHFRCLAGFCMCLCIYKCYLACTTILGSVSGIFRQIQTLFKNILTHIQNLVYLWHTPTTKHIQTSKYIHNTILNIFTKARPWTFDTVLNAPLSYSCYATSRVILQCL